MAIRLVEHPVARHLVTHLRDVKTRPEQFRTAAHKLTVLLALEATRNLPLVHRTVETPLESVEGEILDIGIVVVPILRAGLGMLTPIVEMFPDVSVGYIGLERDHATAVASSYYSKLPPLHGCMTLIVDPMLATGGSACHAVEIVKAAGAESIRILCVVAAPEGVKHLETIHPDVPIFAAALDRELNDKKYILPGLGDFGDRLYGTL